MKNILTIIFVLSFAILIHAENDKWTHEDLHNFLTGLQSKEIEELAVGMKVMDIQTARTTSDSKIALAIEKQLIWLSSNILTYGFRSNKVDYHDIVQWTAKESGINETVLKYSSTFEIERAILEKFFGNIWDNMTQEQRAKLLEEISSNTGINMSKIKGLALAAGRTVLSGLIILVKYKGFSFYRAMATIVASTAKALGIVLPFSVYTTLSSGIAILTGPVGWVLAGVMTLVSIAMIGSADYQKTAAAIIMIHILRSEKEERLGYSRYYYRN